MRWMSPGVLLAVLIVLIGAQVTRLLAPGRGSYPFVLLLACGGTVAGEILAAVSGLGGPAIGPLHPLTDAVLIGAFEVTGAQVVGSSAA